VAPLPTDATHYGQPEVRAYVAPGYGVADGAPTGDARIPADHRPLGTVRVPSRRFRFEGPRGLSTRAALWLRYASYFFIIVMASVVTGACFSSTPGASSGGQWLLLSAAFQLATAAVGSWFVPNHRPEIVQQARSYVFGYTVLPGTGVAIFMWAASHMSNSALNPDVFVTTMQSALPWIFFLPIILPAGMRVLNRVALDDQESMRINTRLDGHQR
jgi:hypothetical protein